VGNYYIPVIKYFRCLPGSKIKEEKMDNLNLDLDESVKSSEYTSSNEPYDVGSGNTSQVITEEQVQAEKDKIVQLSNDSILHGYDLAIEIVAGHGLTDAVKVLVESRSAMEVGLYKSKAERIEGNFGQEEGTGKEDNSSE